MQTDLTKYQVDHLFLLVGSNPLPNYVAAKLLLRSGGIPHFLYSKKTESIAEQLRAVLAADPGTSLIYLPPHHETDAFRVQAAIQSHFQKIPRNSRIGLHYTGGTKVMAIHTYQAIRSFLAKQERSDASYSYLDPELLALRMEREDGEAKTIKLLPAHMRSDVGLTLDTFWSLHGITLNPQKPPHVDPILPEIAAALARHYAQNQREVWTEWLKKPDINTLPFEDVCQILSERNVTTVNGLDQQYFAGRCDPQGRAIHWLQGKWLEDYTLESVQQLKPDHFTHALCGVETACDPGPKFEVDVVALRGYQLFVFSCCVSNKDSECKEKLFEASIRARRLGGDEARFALICPHDNAAKIEHEMDELLNRGTFHVFGRAELEELPKVLRSWVSKVDREAL